MTRTETALRDITDTDVAAEWARHCRNNIVADPWHDHHDANMPSTYVTPSSIVAETQAPMAVDVQTLPLGQFANIRDGGNMPKPPLFFSGLWDDKSGIPGIVFDAITAGALVVIWGTLIMTLAWVSV